MKQIEDYILMGAEHMSEKKSAVGWIMEMTTIIGVFLVCFMFLYNQIEKLDMKLEKQAQRTDKLYEMFIDILKEQKKQGS